MTAQEKEQLAVFCDSLNRDSLLSRPPPPVSSGAFLFGCLMLCATLLFWPELRIYLVQFELYLRSLAG